MTFCRNCGAPIKDGIKFCTSCGSPIPESDIRGESADQKTIDQQTVNYQSADQQPVNPQPAQQWTYAQPSYYPAVPPKKKSNTKKVIIIISVVALVLVAAAIAVIAFAANNVSLEPGVEYDSGFASVTREKQDDFYVFTPVMKEGYIFDYWVLPDGSRSYDKVISVTSGFGTLKGYSTLGYTVTVYSMFGLSIDGDGDYTTYESATVTAEKDVAGFIGWYSADGKLLSTSSEYKLPKKESTVLIAASDTTKYSGSYTLNLEPTTDIVASTSSWYIFDGDSSTLVGVKYGVSKIDMKSSPGSYRIVENGKDSSGTQKSYTYTKEVKGDYVLTYKWTYNLKTYSTTWTVSYDEYKASKDSDVCRSPSSDSDMKAFVNKELSNTSIVTYLTAQSKYMSDAERANFVLKFVQECFQYQYDYDYNGRTEYWKYPIETMVDQRGDCEDTSILCSYLMKSVGFGTALILFDDHAASSVCLTDGTGSYYTVDSKKYYYCETTNNAAVGKMPTGYDEGRIVKIC